MITDFKIFEKKGNNVGPLYHGSRYLFDVFKHHRLGKDQHPLSYLGYHFTPDAVIARKFSKGPNFAFYEVEIIVNKTLKIKESDLVKNIIKFGCDRGYIICSENGLEFVLKLPYLSFDSDSIMDNLIEGELSDVPMKKASKEYKKYLIEQGYDSIKYLNEVEFYVIPDRYDWIVFNSKQIKIIKKDKIIHDNTV